MGTREIMELMPGSRTTIICKDWRQAESIKQLAYRAARINPEKNRRYKCSINYTKPAITIEVLEVIN